MSFLPAPRPRRRSGPRRFATAVLSTLALLLAGIAVAPAAMADTVAVHPVIARYVLDLMNQERAAHHLPPLRMNQDLINSAHGHNVSMAVAQSMSHRLPGEKSLGDRMDAAHYDWSAAGECIGWTSDNTTVGALNIQRYMYNEKAPNDGHRLIILSSAYRDVGISVISDETHRKLWITEDFGHVL